MIVANEAVRSEFKHFAYKDIEQVAFVQDYFELWCGKNYVRCMADTYIEVDAVKTKIPSKEGNWLLTNLIGQNITDVEELEDVVCVSIGDNIKIVVSKDTLPPTDCFHIGCSGLSSVMV